MCGLWWAEYNVLGEKKNIKWESCSEVSDASGGVFFVLEYIIQNFLELNFGHSLRWNWGSLIDLVGNYTGFCVSISWPISHKYQEKSKWLLGELQLKSVRSY